MGGRPVQPAPRHGRGLGAVAAGLPPTGSSADQASSVAGSRRAGRRSRRTRPVPRGALKSRCRTPLRSVSSRSPSRSAHTPWQGAEGEAVPCRSLHQPRRHHDHPGGCSTADHDQDPGQFRTRPRPSPAFTPIPAVQVGCGACIRDAAPQTAAGSCHGPRAPGRRSIEDSRFSEVRRRRWRSGATPCFGVGPRRRSREHRGLRSGGGAHGPERRDRPS